MLKQGNRLHIDKRIQTGRQLVDYLNDVSCRSQGCLLEVGDNKLKCPVGEPFISCRCKHGIKQRKSRSTLKETSSRLPSLGSECKYGIAVRYDRQGNSFLIFFTIVSLTALFLQGNYANFILTSTASLISRMSVIANVLQAIHAEE